MSKATKSEVSNGRRAEARRRIQPALLLLLILQMPLTFDETSAQSAEPRKETNAGNIGGAAPADMDSLLSFFETIVFESEYAASQAEPVVAKWHRPLRIMLKGTVSSLNRRTVEQHVRVLAELTGLDMQIMAPMGEGGNLTIHFLPRKELDRLVVDNVAPSVLRRLGAGGCFFLSFQNPPGHIVKGIIAVNIEFLQQDIRHCLLEELTQSLGLPNDSDMMRPSIFSRVDRLQALAPQDIVLLRTLYHPSMPPGANRQEARMRARAIISDLVGPAAQAR